MPNFYILSHFPSSSKNTKLWHANSGPAKPNSKNGLSPVIPLETVFFGPHIGGTVKCTGGFGGRMAQCRMVHKEICELLLMALESLKTNLAEFSTVLPHHWAILANTSPTENADTAQRLQKLAEMAKVGKPVAQYFSIPMRSIIYRGLQL